MQWIVKKLNKFFRKKRKLTYASFKIYHIITSDCKYNKRNKMFKVILLTIKKEYIGNKCKIQRNCLNSN